MTKGNLDWDALGAMADRFQGDGEETPWNVEAFNAGFEACYVRHAPISECPKADAVGNWYHKSWRAGWADASMQRMADEAES